jgi:site-specific DNA-methyltransferase (adenine-specific)
MTLQDFTTQYKLSTITNKIICGDALTELKKIPSESIDVCLTSPPYYKCRDFGHPEQIGQESSIICY